jgi:hypothetical protein
MPALSTNARHEYYVELGNSLPPPVNDNPEYRQRRLTTAIEAFEALRPGDAYEARLAVQIVLTGAHAAETLREAGCFRDDFAKKARCRAQAASMMREERASKRMLAQEQKVRLATAAVADAATAKPATAAAPMPQAGGEATPPVQASTAAPLPGPISAAPPRPAAIKAAAPVSAGSLPPPSPEAIAAAEAFVEQNGVAAAQIRYDGGITPKSKAYFHDVTFPTDPAVIDALVRGSSELLTLLDEAGGEELDEAA